MASSSSMSASAATDSAADDSAEQSAASQQSGLVEEVLAPISEDAPCGTDATYDDDFQLVKRKVDALSSFSGRIDQEKALAGEDESFVQPEEDEAESPFTLIEATSRRILREKSKDLRIACYLGLALSHERGVVGAADGIAALRALVGTYWEELYPTPRRMRARSAAFTFLFQRLHNLLDEAEPTAQDGVSLERALEDLQALQAVLAEKMGDQAPITSSLKKTLEALLHRVPDSSSEPDDAAVEPDAPSESETADDPSDETGEIHAERRTDTESKSEEPSETQRNGQAKGSGGAPLSSMEGSPESLSKQEANQRLLQIATAMREQDDTQVTPYRVARALRWGTLRSLPPHDDGNQRTRIAPPPKQRRTYLLGLPEQEIPERLVNDAEDSFHQSPFHFWLDLQRLLVQGLGALGEPYEAAALAVKRECALLVERLPGLPELSFRDGTPFASPSTREWLDTSVRSTFDRGGGDEKTSTEKGELTEQFQQARRKLGAGDLPGALRLMEAGGDSSAVPSQQTRFRRRLYRALLCARAGQHAVARPVLEALSEEADRRDLSTWDPPLALKVWISLYECLAALAKERSEENRRQGQQRGGADYGGPSGASAGADDLEARAAHAFGRICEIDPERALSLRGETTS